MKSLDLQCWAGLTSRPLISFVHSIIRIFGLHEPSESTEPCKSSTLACFTFNTLSLGIITSTLHRCVVVHWQTNMALERPLREVIWEDRNLPVTHLSGRSYPERGFLLRRRKKGRKRERIGTPGQKWLHPPYQITDNTIPLRRWDEPASETHLLRLLRRTFFCVCIMKMSASWASLWAAGHWSELWESWQTIGKFYFTRSKL